MTSLLRNKWIDTALRAEYRHRGRPAERTGFVQMLELFRADPETNQIVIAGIRVAEAPSVLGKVLDVVAPERP